MSSQQYCLIMGAVDAKIRGYMAAHQNICHLQTGPNTHTMAAFRMPVSVDHFNQTTSTATPNVYHTASVLKYLNIQVQNLQNWTNIPAEILNFVATQTQNSVQQIAHLPTEPNNVQRYKTCTAKPVADKPGNSKAY